MLRCAITDGAAADFVNTTQIDRLLNQVRRWAADGIDMIQLREKNLDAGALFALAEAILRVVGETNSSTKLLINGRADIAIAARAHGVHLTAAPDELTPEQVRTLFSHAGRPAPVVGVSCHTIEEVRRAHADAADYILFGPVFEKRVRGDVVSQGIGVELLREACDTARPVPVLALGGVTRTNARECLQAGAAGIAGIRLFA